jgi:hypothetical protein
MDITSLLIPLVIIIAVVFIVWRLTNASDEKEYSNTLLKVRKKRQGSIYGSSNSSQDIVGAVAVKKVEPKAPTEVPDPPQEFQDISLTSYTDYQKAVKSKKEFESLRKPHPLLISLSKSITDAQELIKIIKSDPELVAKVLNMANSPFFGLRKAITDINHAVIYLGIAQVKNLATQFAISQSFEFSSEAQQETYDKIWKTSFIASSMALLIARDAELENSSSLSTMCLLGYLGDIAMLSSKPQVADLYLPTMPFYKRVRAMQAMFNTNAATMGGVFAQHLTLPGEIHNGIGLGYQSLTNDWDGIDISDEEKRDIVFCYAVSRMAEFVVLENDTNFLKSASLDYARVQRPELYQLSKQLKECGLSAVQKVIESAQFRAKSLDMMSKFSEAF